MYLCFYTIALIRFSYVFNQNLHLPSEFCVFLYINKDIYRKSWFINIHQNAGNEMFDAQMFPDPSHPQ